MADDYGGVVCLKIQMNKLINYQYELFEVAYISKSYLTLAL